MIDWCKVEKVFFDKICEIPCIPCEGMILIQETNIKLNLFEFSILSNDWVFIYEISGFGFESSYSHLITL